MRGEIFENWVFSEIVKKFVNHGQSPSIYFWRTQGGQEVDFLIERRKNLWAIEVKSGMTIHPEMVKSFRKVILSWNYKNVSTSVFYGGEDQYRILDSQIIPWKELDNYLEREIFGTD